MNIRDICLRAAEAKKKCDRTRRWGVVMVYVLWYAIWLLIGSLVYSLLWPVESGGADRIRQSEIRNPKSEIEARQETTGWRWASPAVEGGGPVPPGPRPAAPQVRLWRVTAYCPCPICCGPRACGITASGARADHPLVAGPPWLAFGTPLKIPGYAGGSAVRVEDRGGAITEGRLDVLMPTHAQARAWGVRDLAVACGHSGT